METILKNFIIVDKIKMDDRYKDKRIFMTLPCYNESDFKNIFLKKSLPYISQIKNPFFINFISNNPNFNVLSCDQIINQYTRSYNITCTDITNVANARNLGLREFKKVHKHFDYFLTLDDDTILKQGSIEKAIFILQESGYDFIGQDFLQIKSCLYPLYGSF